MQVFENFAPEAEKQIAGAITWSREIDLDLAIDPPGRRGHAPVLEESRRFVETSNDQALGERNDQG